MVEDIWIIGYKEINNSWGVRNGCKQEWQNKGEYEEEFKNFKIEALSCVVVLRQSGNEIYVPIKYQDYFFPKCFEKALDNLEIKSLFKSKIVETVIDGEFQNLYYFSAYEYMNNKTNRPYCYIYIKDNRLCDLEKSKVINKLLKLQDNLEVGI